MRTDPVRVVPLPAVPDRRPRRAVRNSRLQVLPLIFLLSCSALPFSAGRLEGALRDFDSPRPAVRDLAEVTLRRMGEDAVPALRALVKTGTEDQRYRAVRVLGRIGPGAADAVPDLVALLTGADLSIPSALASALAGIGAPAEPALIPLLESRDEMIRYWAVVSLGEMRSPSAAAMGALIGRTVDPTDAVAARAEMLIIAAGRRIRPQLWKVAEGEDMDLALRAAELLIRMGQLRAESAEDAGSDQDEADAGGPEKLGLPGAVLAAAIAPPLDPVSSGAIGRPEPRAGDEPRGLLNIAVADFSAANTSSGSAAVASDWLRGALVRSGAFNVIERESMQKVLAEQGFQRTGCTEQDCAVRLGRILNVKRMIVGRFDKFIESYVLSARIVDVETGKVTHADSAKGRTEDDLERAIQQLADRLAGQSRTNKM